MKEYEKKKILKLEKIVQIYAAFYHNEYAARAKRGKGELFDKTTVEVLVSGIDAEKVIHSYEWYEKICRVLTIYRKCRRSSSVRMDFFEYLDFDVEEDSYYKEMDKYAFLNTGDLLLLNTISNLEKRCVYDSKEEYVIEAIKIAKNAVLNSGLLPSQATKNNTIFTTIQSEINTY